MHSKIGSLFEESSICLNLLSWFTSYSILVAFPQNVHYQRPLGSIETEGVLIVHFHAAEIDEILIIHFTVA